MSMAQALLPEYDHEMANTRKFLERAPDDRLSWKPHEKSFTIAQLGTHISNVPAWIALTINADSFDVAPPGQQPYREPEKESHADMLKAFDENVRQGREAIAA